MLLKSFRLALIGLLLSLSFSVRAAVSEEAAARLLPDKIGKVTATGAATLWPGAVGLAAPEHFRVESAAVRIYRTPQGEKITATLFATASDHAAYALLLKDLDETKGTLDEAGKVGLASFSGPRLLAFAQGPAYVTLEGTARPVSLADLGRQLAATLDAGEGEIPPLAKHLPDGTPNRIFYAVTSGALNAFTGNPPVFSALDFAGGAEAVSAGYGPARLVLVEVTTPQLATVNDTAIQSKIIELQAGGQPVPTLYKRVGNYAAFVFDAPDTATAQQLIDQIKYEQTVQWLGSNPYHLINAQKRYVAFTSEIFVSVMKVSGLAVLLVLGIGGTFGALVFRRRRTQQTAAMYSDAGGMMRLNLDDINGETNQARLLGKNEK